VPRNKRNYYSANLGGLVKITAHLITKEENMGELFTGEEPDEPIDPELEKQLAYVLCHEMDQEQAAVMLLRHRQGMNDRQIGRQTGLGRHEVQQLGMAGSKFLFKRFSPFN
jgi:DNA-directed RNA polymerase specialized sigma subunit